MSLHVSDIEYAPSPASVSNAPKAEVPSIVARLPPIRSSIPSGSV
jgi:hypothetical protein